MNWQQYWDLNAVEATKLYIDSFPTNILLDADGKVIERNITLEALEEFLRLKLSTEKNTIDGK